MPNANDKPAWISVVTLTYQGDPESAGDILPEELQQLRREAFPRSPRRDAMSDPAYRAVKIAPLESGRLLVSVVSNLGESDVHGRPALRATACLIDRVGLSGPLRDLGAGKDALTKWIPSKGVAGFVAAASESSAWESDRESEAIRAAFASRAEFHSHVAGALLRPRVDVFSAQAVDAFDVLRPALLLLPAWRLLQLELATGSIESDSREKVLCVTGRPDTRGGLGSLLGHREPVVDCDEHTVKPASPGPSELVAALADAPWPGISVRERLRLLLGWMDSRNLGSPFDSAPVLEAMRGAVKRVEAVERNMWGWR